MTTPDRSGPPGRRAAIAAGLTLVFAATWVSCAVWSAPVVAKVAQVTGRGVALGLLAAVLVVLLLIAPALASRRAHRALALRRGDRAPRRLTVFMLVLLVAYALTLGVVALGAQGGLVAVFESSGAVLSHFPFAAQAATTGASAPMTAPVGTSGRLDCALQAAMAPHRYPGFAHLRVHGAEFDEDLPNQAAQCGPMGTTDLGSHLGLPREGEGAMFYTCSPDTWIQMKSEAQSTDEARLSETAVIEVTPTKRDFNTRHLLGTFLQRPKITVGPGARSAHVEAVVREKVDDTSTIQVEIDFDCTK